MRLLAIGTMLVLLGAAPAAAQIAGSMRGLSGASSLRGEIRRESPGNPTLAQRVSVLRQVGSLRADIRAGREAGQLSRSAARALYREGHRIEASSSRYARGGYSDAEISMLQSRAEALRAAIVTRRTQGLQAK